MSLKPKEIESCLLHKLGFQKAEKHKKKHKWFELKVPGFGTIFTHLSHNNTALSDELECQMAKQLHVSHRIFVEAVRCTVLAVEYLEEVKKPLGRSASFSRKEPVS